MGVIAVDLTNSHEFKPVRKRRINEKPGTATAALISLDPGETTGWSLMVVKPECLVDERVKVLGSILDHQHGQVDCYRGNSKIHNEGECLAVGDLWSLIDSWPNAAVVMEDFIIRINNRSREFLSPVRIIAKIEQLLWEEGRMYFRQQPGDAKTTATDARLKEWGMLAEDGLGHARDADRHAIIFLRKATQSAKLRAQAWPHLFASKGVSA